MGCGTSRSPARVGVITEDDASLYEDFFPPMVDGSWMGESVRDPSSSFCHSSSPPPYTPLPLSGHVTLMLGQSSSPAKRQDSTQSATITRDFTGAPREEEYEAAPGSVPESSYRSRERRDSGASHRRVSREGEMEVQQAAAEMSRQHSTDRNSTPAPSDPARTENDEQEVPTEQSRDSSFPGYQEEFLRPPRLEILGSSAARPPSPFPRSRSLSFQLPPLRTIQQPAGEPLPPPPPELLVQPFRLPPLRELPPLLDTRGSGTSRRKRGRSHSSTLQTSTLLSSVQDQSTATVVQS